MSESGPVDRVVFGPVAAVRPWLFAKALYVLLALDVWHTLVGPAWRYGAAGFNVAHFAILDALPMPTREAYIGMLVLVGAMGFTAAALPRTPRALSIAIAVLYTWGWSCSMLDSYQHHYLITVLLVATCFFPRLTAVDLFGRGAPIPVATAKASKKKGTPPGVTLFPDGLVARIRSLGWTLVTSFAGVVYSFTAVSKWEPEWRSGAALRDITHGGASMQAPMDFAGELGLDADTVFAILGSGMIVVQVVCAIGYLTASLRDGAPSEAETKALEAQWAAMVAERTRITIAAAVSIMIALGVGVSFSWIGALVVMALGITIGMPRVFHRFAFAPLGRPRVLSIVASLALLLALSFHVGAEYIGLQIGWFSYYMIVLALVALVPAHWLAALAAVVTQPVRSADESVFDRVPLMAPVLGLVAAGAAAYAGVEIDLPGAYTTSIAVGLVALALGVGAMMRPALRPTLARAAAGLGVGMIVCGISMTRGTERYDFYRFAGGDFRRRHEYRQALEAYVEANRYAPPGESREDRVHEMEDAIRNGTP